MPGVFRPYTLTDILGSLSDGIDAAVQGDTSATGTGYFTEADETLGITDSATVTGPLSKTWDSGEWGQFLWG